MSSYLRSTRTTGTSLDPRLPLVAQRSAHGAGRLRSLHFLLLALLLFSQSAMAASNPQITVGSGTAASCTETALKAALTTASAGGGGAINFNCGRAPVAIGLSQPAEVGGMQVLLVLPDNTTIDGRGLITLDGTGTAIVALVDQGVTVLLRHLSIVNGLGVDDSPAGGIINNGTLTIEGCTLSANSSHSTGAIFNQGVLTVNGSMISGNGGFDFAGGITSSGMLSVNNTTFEHNSSGVSGGAVFNSGTLFVRGSTFSQNLAVNAGAGIYTSATATVRRSAFSDNIANSAGGGIFAAAGTLAVARSSFSGNFGRFGGGLSVSNGAVTIDHSDFSQNQAGTEGGGMFTAGPLAIDHSTITENIALSDGGGIFVCVEGQVLPSPLPPHPCHGTLTLTHTAVTGNTPDDIGP